MAQSHYLTRPLKILLFGLAVVFAGSAAILLNWFSSAATVIGTSPEQAITLPRGTSSGVLGPGEQRWFSFSPDPTNKIEDIELNAVFTAGNGTSLQNVNFELFAAGEVIAWQQGAKANPTNFGAGMALAASDAPGLSERVWRGALMSDGLYYLLLRNNTEAAVDYWLFDNTPVAIPPAEPVPAPTEVPLAAPVAASPPVPVVSDSPATAAPLTTERVNGSLAPGQDIWFSFNVDNSPGEVFEPMALTLITTPNDYNQINSIPLDIYTTAAVASWSPENRDNFENVGAGSVVQRDNDPWTGEKVWSGWIVSGDTYYVKIANNHTAPIDYWLFTGDVYNPQLGN